MRSDEEKEWGRRNERENQMAERLWESELEIAGKKDNERIRDRGRNEEWEKEREREYEIVGSIGGERKEKERQKEWE